MRFLGSQLLQPLLEIRVQSSLVIVYENARGDVHRVDEAESLPDSAFSEAFLHFAGDVHQRRGGREFRTMSSLR